MEGPGYFRAVSVAAPWSEEWTLEVGRAFDVSLQLVDQEPSALPPNARILVRNQWLAAIRAFARFVALRGPEHLEWCGQLRSLLLKFLYNTGARATETAQLRVSSLLPEAGSGNRLIVRLEGKGHKTRLCPLWQSTSGKLGAAVRDRPADEHVFLNRCGRAGARVSSDGTSKGPG